MIHLKQDNLFKCKVFEWIVVNDYIFSDWLHRVKLGVFSILNQINFSKSSFANNASYTKIIELRYINFTLWKQSRTSFFSLNYVVNFYLRTCSWLVGCVSVLHLVCVVFVDVRFCGHWGGSIFHIYIFLEVHTSILWALNKT